MENLLIVAWRSSVYAVNLTGPRTDHCGTLQLRSVGSVCPVDVLNNPSNC